jgi:hypothetical protein
MQVEPWMINTLMAVIAGAFAVFVWAAKIFSSVMGDLKRTDSKLADEIQEMKLLITGQYVKQDKFDQVIAVMFSKLDRIDEKKDTTLSILNAMFQKIDRIGMQ